MSPLSGRVPLPGSPGQSPSPHPDTEQVYPDGKLKAGADTSEPDTQKKPSSQSAVGAVRPGRPQYLPAEQGVQSA